MSRPLVLAMLVVAGCGQVSSNPGGDDAPPPDADTTMPPDACVAETDQELCGQRGCEPLTTTDRCGTMRTVDCGACSGDDVCVANRCAAAACERLDFPMSTVIAALSSPNTGEHLVGVSASGDTILWMAAPNFDCAQGSTLRLADTVAGVTTVHELSAVPALGSFAGIMPFYMALSPDGLTIYAQVPFQGLRASKRSAIGRVDFSNPAEPSELAAVAPPAASWMTPVFSPDGLAFYFWVLGMPDPQQNGVYESVRASTSAAFPPGRRISLPAMPHAVSSDRMTAFVDQQGTTLVYTRAGQSKPFVNPNAPAPPPTVPGHTTRALGSCERVIGNCGPMFGACNTQDLCLYTR